MNTPILPQLEYEIDTESLLEDLESELDFQYFQEFDSKTEERVLQNPQLGAYRLA